MTSCAAGGMGIASIGDLEDDLGVPADDPHLDRRSRLGRAAPRFRRDWRPAGTADCGPHTGQVASHIQAQRPVRMRQLRLADHLPTDLVHVEARGIDRNAAAQPAPREIEQLLDEPRRLRERWS